MFFFIIVFTMFIDPPSSPVSGEKSVRDASHLNPPSVGGPSPSQYAGAEAAGGLTQPSDLTMPSFTNISQDIPQLPVCGPTSSQSAGLGSAGGHSQPPGLTVPSFTSISQDIPQLTVCGPSSSQYADGGAAGGHSLPGLIVPSLTSSSSVPHHLICSRSTGSSE